MAQTASGGQQKAEMQRAISLMMSAAIKLAEAPRASGPPTQVSEVLHSTASLFGTPTKTTMPQHVGPSTEAIEWGFGQPILVPESTVEVSSAVLDLRRKF